MNEQGIGLGERVRDAVDGAALGIETLAVLIIVVAVAHGTIRYLIHRKSTPTGVAYSSYKVQLGKALLVGLELLVAADIVRTVALSPTLADVAMLGILVLIRTFLSWSLVVEIEGRWPWKSVGAESPDGQETGTP